MNIKPYKPQRKIFVQTPLKTLQSAAILIEVPNGNKNENRVIAVVIAF